MKTLLNESEVIHLEQENTLKYGNLHILLNFIPYKDKKLRG
jgi:hypothetical protein